MSELTLLMGYVSNAVKKGWVFLHHYHPDFSVMQH